MDEFLSILAEVESFAQAAEDGHTAALGQAEIALADLRDCYRALPETDKAQALPQATAVSDRIKALKDKAAAVRAAKAAAAAPFDPAAAFAAAVGGAGFGEQIILDFEPSAPTRVFTGQPTPETLLDHLGLPSFRPGQRDAVQAALDGRDSLIIMPTGGGKSLCYQLPGLASSQLTVVVTPLVALMRDQYQRLARDGHPAVMLASGLSEEHNRDAIDQIYDGSARIVFCSPERFASKAFNAAIESRQVGLFVVDEAHCVAEWGHDFRPDYLRLHHALIRLGHPTVMALTATATPQVAKEIRDRLGLRDPLIVQGGFDRPNISFDVITLGGEGAVARKHRLLQAGLRMPENLPAVVYAGTRKDTEAVATALLQEGFDAVYYHAGLTPDKRLKAQEQFMSGERTIIVATNAFGMGVDKADIRSVWHWALPTSLEGFYQEAGRGGRDGQPARAVLLSMRADLGRLINFNKRRSTTVETVQAYLDRLRHSAKGKATIVIDPPASDEDRICLAICERANALSFEPAGQGRLHITFSGHLDTARARRACEIAKERGWEAYRSVERFSSSEVCRRQQLLDHFGDATAPAPEGRCCDVCDPVDWLPDPESLSSAPLPKPTVAPRPGAARATKAAPPAKASKTTAKPLSSHDQPLLDALVAWRKATANGKPAYQVAHNATLEAIAAGRPQTVQALSDVKGVGPRFLQQHGGTILELVKAHA